ncbi:MAG: quinoprotein relay system zinc metallohydrolase 1 [Hyphomicrobium sp.]
MNCPPVGASSHKLSRRQAMSALAGSALFPWLRIGGAMAAPLSYDLKPEKLANGIWVLRGIPEAISITNGGAIANVSIIDTTAGAVIIDTGPSLRYGEALHMVAKKLTGKDVVRVYLTHFHPDHVFGNQAFDAAIIAAPQGVIDGLKQLGNSFADAMYRAAGDWMRGTELVLPQHVVTNEPEDFGNRRLRPLLLRGHSASDLVIFDELSGILFGGDLVFLDRAPTTPHADIERWRITLATLGGIPHNLLVPGHGPAEPGDRGIRQTRDWLETVEAQIKTAFEKGLDIGEATALPMPEWTAKIALSRYEYERTVMHLYPKLESSRWPRVDQKT